MAENNLRGGDRGIIPVAMAYKNTVVYFMSGTGNSHRVSTWIGKHAEENGSNVRIVPIGCAQSAQELERGIDTLLCVVTPTHGFTTPWHVLKCVWRLPRGKSTHAFCVATRAGFKFGSVFIPGISGTATFLVALLLMLKGYRVRGSMSVDMPSNWFSLHPIQSRKSQEAIIDRAEKKVAHVTRRILSNQKVWLTLNNVYEITLGVALSLISLAYLLVGRFFLAKLFFANGNCNGCGLCASNCTVGAIKMRGRANPRPFWKYNCESCMRCAALCPHHAVEAGQSWGVILYLISTAPVLAYLLSGLDMYPGSGDFKELWFSGYLNLVYFYPAIFVSYYIFHMIMRIPAINWLFTHTTLTHFWGRYREPTTKLKHLAAQENEARIQPNEKHGR